MIEKPKRPKKIPNQDNKQPQTIEQLIKRYDLDNTKIYDFLDELVGTLKESQTVVSSTEPIGANREKVWIQNTNTERKIYVKNDNDIYEEFINKEDTLEKYSTIEQKIGTWIDGKPVYRKVIEIQPASFGNGTATAGATYKIGHGINNLNMATRCDVYWKRNGQQQRKFPSIYYNDMAWSGQAFVDIVDNGIVVFELGTSILNAIRTANYIYIVLEYTKTTD